MTLKLAQFCDDPNKIPTKSSYPQKIFIFLKTPKNIEFRISNPENWPSLRMCENIRVPTPPPPGAHSWMPKCTQKCQQTFFRLWKAYYQAHHTHTVTPTPRTQNQIF